MKRRIKLSIALVMSIILVSLMISNSTVQAQRNQRFSGDTGMLTLGPDQILRMEVIEYQDGDDYFVRFRQINYDQGTCNNGICKYGIASQSQTGIISLSPGEAAVFEGVPDQPIINGRVRMFVESNKPIKVNAQIIDAPTGTVTGIIAILIS